jgi:DNA-binding GntR family transcriptional regulator
MANYRADNSGAYDSETTLTQRTYENLRTEIITGQFKPGDRLVRRGLSKRLGVSPMPVTEALYMLELDGLVENRPLYGCRVRPLTIDDLRDDQILREALECQAARIAAEQAEKHDFDRLMTKARILDRMMAGENSNAKLGMELHLEFHVSVAELSNSTRLANEIRRVWLRLLMRINWLKATRYKKVPEDWHQYLVNILKKGDPGQAETCMREHVRFGNEDDQAALEEYLSGEDK